MAETKAWADRTVKNWRWWVVLPIAMALVPVAFVLYSAGWISKAADWILHNTVGPLLRWSRKKPAKLKEPK